MVYLEVAEVAEAEAAAAGGAERWREVGMEGS